MKTAYDPAAKFELKVTEVEFRRTPAGRQLMARIYQPQGPGPFPTVLDLHGGAWRRKDRLDVAQLLAMRPRDTRYTAIPLPAAPSLDATVAYMASRSPISDPYARFQQAEKMKRAGMIENSKIYFNPWDTIYEGNPQQMLERREPVALCRC